MSQSLGKRIFLIPLEIFGKVFAGLLIAIILSIIIEWLGMTFFWRDSPHHAKEMLNYEYTLVSNSFESSIFGLYPHEIIKSAIAHVVQFSHKMGITNFLLSTDAEANFLQRFIHGFADYLSAAGYIFLLVLMRTIVFMLSLPWYIICGLVALIDGMVERNIRKFEGGIEHGMIYHIAKSNLSFSISLAFILYLGMPFSIHPSIILVPSGFLFGLIIYITAWSFKKYI